MSAEMSALQEREVEPSPRVLSRIAGVLYLLVIAIGLFGELFVRGRVIVPGDAAATAANLKSMESLWRVGIAAELFMLICALLLALTLFILLRPVSRDLAFLAVLFNLISIALEAGNKLHLMAVLFPLGTGKSLQAFEPGQLHALANLSLRHHSYGFAMSLIFFGCVCVVVGYLIYRSRYLPKALGVMMQLAGLSYLANSFAIVLAPAFAASLFPMILIPSFIGEASLCIWLLVKGVNVEKWRLRAGLQPLGSAAAV